MPASWAVALCAYVLAALFAERRQHEVRARGERSPCAGGTDGWGGHNIRVGRRQRFITAQRERGASTWGSTRRETFTATGFLSRVHADDRETVRRRSCAGSTPNTLTYTVAFRFKQSESREIWLEETAKAEFDDSGPSCYASKVSLSMSPRASESEDQQSLLIAAARSSRQTPAVSYCRHRQGHAAAQQFIRRLHWSNGSHAFSPWPMHMQYSARIAGPVPILLSLSSVSLRPAQQTQTR